MSRVDLIVSFLSSVPADVVPKFSRQVLNVVVNAGSDDQYTNWWKQHSDTHGNVFPTVFKQFGAGLPAGSTLGRVGVVGFSRGGIGARETLRANDAGNIDAVIICDGVHGSYIDPFKKSLFAPQYSPIIAAGTAAAKNTGSAPLCMITHSSIIPPGFPSTTETSNLLWDEVLKTAPANYESTYWADLDRLAYPGETGVIRDGSFGPVAWSAFDDSWFDRRSANNFSVFGWGDPNGKGGVRVRDVAGGGHCDHIFQARKVLPALLEFYVARRWNSALGGTSGIGASFGALGDDSGAQEYDAKAQQPLVAPGGLTQYIPKIAGGCPYPPPGMVIVGSKDNPCALVPGQIPRPPVQRAPSQTDPALLLAGLGGGIAGYLVADWLAKKYGLPKWLGRRA